MNNIVLVDFSWLYHKSWFMHGDLSFVTKDKVYKTGGMFGCISSIKYLRNRYNCPVVIVTEPKVNFRYKLDETYKKGRPQKDPDMYVLWGESQSALSIIPNVVIISSDEEGEADDCLASFIWHNKDKFDRFLIYGTDNDYLQIPSVSELREKVFYCPRSGKEKDDILMKEYCLNKYEVDISKILLWRSVFGDKSDNLPTVAPRIQKKVVRGWFAREEVIDIKSLLAEAWNNRENPNAEKLIHNQKVLEHNYEMMRLRQLKLKKVEVDKKPLEYFIKEYGMKSLQEAVLGKYEL
jgi:5'-3' exonuclease